MSEASPRTLLDKLWDGHVAEAVDPELGLDLIYVDLHLIHEIPARGAFDQLRGRGLDVRRPELAVALVDHMIPTSGDLDPASYPPAAIDYIDSLRDNCESLGIAFLAPAGDQGGIVHVVAPEAGLVIPGISLACADSHTSTLGALATLAFPINATEMVQLLACQALLRRRPRTMRITLDGSPPDSVTSKDISLAAITQLGANFGAGYAVEFQGRAVAEMSVEQRMTLCNMGTELGATLTMAAADEKTVEYCRLHAPDGVEDVLGGAEPADLVSDPGASFDLEERVEIGSLEPFVTWGTRPDQAVPISGVVPDPAAMADAEDASAARDALAYVGLAPGEPVRDIAADLIFIGSCTNARIEDLREAAAVLDRRRVAGGVRAMVVPGSSSVKRAAEAEGLDQVFRAAGLEWHESACSLCLAGPFDRLAPGTRCVSTTNRNFPHRQGRGVVTHLVSPAVAAASAVAGHIASPEDL